MIYVNDEYIPKTYKYLVDYNDNYVVLARDSYADGDYQFPDTIDVKIQYFSPCTQVLSSSRTYYNHTNFVDISSEISNSFIYSRDYIPLISLSLFIVILLMFIFNGLTRLIKRGGVLFNR